MRPPLLPLGATFTISTPPPLREFEEEPERKCFENICMENDNKKNYEISCVCVCVCVCVNVRMSPDVMGMPGWPTTPCDCVGCDILFLWLRELSVGPVRTGPPSGTSGRKKVTQQRIGSGVTCVNACGVVRPHVHTLKRTNDASCIQKASFLLLDMSSIYVPCSRYC